MSWFGTASTLGECPRWDAGTGTLSWVDIDGGTLFTAVLEQGRWRWDSRSVGAPLAGAVRGANGEMVLAVGRDLRLRDRLVPVERERGSGPAVRLNEMVTDPRGRIWVGSMAYDWTPGAGSLHRVGLRGDVTQVVSGVTIANGIGFSPDAATMYATDTHTARITAWDYDEASGVPDRPRVLVEVSDGKPDGMAVDTDGNIWSAMAGAGHVRCFSPAGRELHREPVPVPVPTSCCFAGPGRDRLVVTTSRKRLADDILARHPESGRTWDAGRVGATGLPQPPFAGALSAAAPPSASA